MRLLAIAMVALAGGGCATLLAPGPDLVHVDSGPAGAAVIVDGSVVGQTPCDAPIPRDSSGVVTVRAPGYVAETRKLEREGNPLFALSILTLCPICIIVDVATGNTARFGGAPIEVTLSPGGKDFEKLMERRIAEKKLGKRVCRATDPELEALRPAGYESEDEKDCVPMPPPEKRAPRKPEERPSPRQLPPPIRPGNSGQ